MNDRNGTYEDEDEEQMIRLAEQMSLQVEYNLHWNPNNLGEIHDQLTSFEHTINDHLGMNDSLRDIDQPISDYQMRALFYGEQSEKDSNMDTFHDYNFDGYDKLSNNVLSINKNLKWYQEKIVEETERTQSVSNCCIL